MSTLVERGDTIEALETRLDEGYNREYEYAREISDLKGDLEEEQELRASLEEKLESFEELNNGIIANFTKDRGHAHANLKVLERKHNELVNLSSSTANANDACATNYTTCEASILKENVELRAQLEVLTSKYGKLEEIHEKLL